jgi:mannose-6-phosphate isomerase-like protein (cupin superfamily)
MPNETETLMNERRLNELILEALEQAAQMVLTLGKSEGSATNRHSRSDQWLMVIRGNGTAIVNGRRYPLRAAQLFLIEHGDRHEIRNGGNEDLVTLKFYVPPGYAPDGRELPAGKRPRARVIIEAQPLNSH